MSRSTRRRFIRSGFAAAGLGLLSGCGGLARPPWQPARAPRIGYLALRTSSAERLDLFRAGLRELGYVEGRTIVIEERLAEAPQQFPALAVELASLPVDVIVTAAGGPSTRVALGATRTIPIVMAGQGDPLRDGSVANLARPGGNVTGLSTLGPQAQGKRLELLREMVPSLARVLFLADTVAAQAAGGLEETQEAAQSLGVQVIAPTVRTAADVPAAFEAAVQHQAEAVVVAGSLLVAEPGRIVEFAAAARLPLMAADREFPAVGGLASYGTNRPALFRRAATFVDKILKGAKPGDLPVEQATMFDFVINLQAAEALGLTIPPSVLRQATEVIR